MKLIIAGSRNITDYDIMVSTIEWFDDFLKDGFINKPHYYIESVVYGGCGGVDTLGKEWARSHDIKVDSYRADWDRYGKAAGPIRNKAMADYGDRLLALWDGKSRGTQSMILEMCKQNKPVYVFDVGIYEIKS